MKSVWRGVVKIGSEMGVDNNLNLQNKEHLRKHTTFNAVIGRRAYIWSRTLGTPGMLTRNSKLMVSHLSGMNFCNVFFLFVVSN